MNSKLRYITILFFCTLLFSCKKSKKEEKENSDATPMVMADTTYSAVENKAKLVWTAYKFTDKVGVSGTFNNFELLLNNETSSLEKFLIGDKIVINTKSVNSGNEIRDDKIRTHFFNVMNTDTIWGEILDAAGGKGHLTLELNKIKDTVDYMYSKKEDTLLINTTIDLTNWSGDNAISSLNRECYELHMGADKISKLWPNFDINLKIPFKKNSNSNQ
ncbi:YceI family protein [Maribacter sp. CXY002]|uniref:YceI family protein n=1 Tax=Maribacter luteocoastalis TaxID=3407671 RepID=UPI003B66DF8A